MSLADFSLFLPGSTNTNYLTGLQKKKIIKRIYYHLVQIQIILK
jgi:hypothetical protein